MLCSLKLLLKPLVKPVSAVAYPAQPPCSPSDVSSLADVAPASPRLASASIPSVVTSLTLSLDNPFCVQLVPEFSNTELQCDLLFLVLPYKANKLSLISH